jgi:hypothetical protein
VLQVVDAEQVSYVTKQLLTRWRTSQHCGQEPSRLLNQSGRQQKAHVALDGKTLRGSLKHEAPHQAPVHLLALYESATGIVLAHEPRPGKRE